MSGTDGNGETGSAEGAPRPSIEEALAAFGEPRDRVDRIGLFVAQRTVDVTRMIELQAQGMADVLKLQSDMILLLGERVARLEARLEAMRDMPSDDEEGTIQ
jgi:hypothetical protein